MSRFISKAVKTFNKNKKGVTMLEYGLIAALVAAVSITVLTNLGTSISTKFQAVQTAVSK